MGEFALDRTPSRFCNLLDAAHSELIVGRIADAMREIGRIGEPRSDHLAEIISGVRDCIVRGEIQSAICILESARFERDRDAVSQAYREALPKRSGSVAA